MFRVSKSMPKSNDSIKDKMETAKLAGYTILPSRESAKKAVLVAKTVCLTVFIIYIAVPIFVRANSWILPKVVFSNLVRWPPFIDLSKPSDFGLNTTRNFYLQTDNGVHVGVWHTLPSSLVQDGGPADPYEYEQLLKSGKRIILYLHGNSGTRGGYHRVQLYKLLASLDFHIITFDYRGFGDSTGTPTEDGVVHDSHFMYRWIKERNNGQPIFLWGHSLGTAITTKLAKKLCELDDHPPGIILEAPFNNIREAAANHPFAIPYRLLPWFTWVFVDGIKEHGIHFSTDENIRSVSPPILILHAEDDAVVPFHLGEKLYEHAKQSKPDHHAVVEFKRFPAHHGFGHKHIFKSPELPEIIRSFVHKALERKK
ncbi:lysophosphatidylserine lipase ABHD12-like isoform X1 [Haliotis rufescens]|uniref:lysophosphatidylserine lipase ABHD12-like isoform X1 n=1 Tax=Haliotis rufescens TaxID=6454 RepID=UPI00201EBC39|nr:lysophosphatidylserine lipase ABHD12-like isoform X1 [Haliotis rufescens]